MGRGKVGRRRNPGPDCFERGSGAARGPEVPSNLTGRALSRVHRADA
jgi:hypothetical protein